MRTFYANAVFSGDSKNIFVSHVAELDIIEFGHLHLLARAKPRQRKSYD